MFSLQASFWGAQLLFICWTFLTLGFFFTLLSFRISCFYLSLVLIFFYLFWLLHVLIFNHYLWDVIFNGGVFLVILVLIFDDIVTWIILSVWWVLIFICLLFNAFFIFSIFGDVVIVLVFVCWKYFIFFTLCLVVFVCDWYVWDPLKIGYLLVISGCFSLVAKSFTLDMTWSFIGSYIHMKVWSYFPVARDVKWYPPLSFSGISATSPTVLCFVLLVVHM